MVALGFEQELWKMADKLRGNIESSEYKHVILGLVFLKYISDSFEEKYNELAEEGDGFEDDENNENYENYDLDDEDSEDEDNEDEDNEVVEEDENLDVNVWNNHSISESSNLNLTNEEINYLVKECREGNIDAKYKLMCALQDTIAQGVWIFYNNLDIKPKPIDIEEGIMEGNAIFSDAIKSFNPQKKVKFKTHLINRVIYAVKKHNKIFQFKLIIPDSVRRNKEIDLNDYLAEIDYTYNFLYNSHIRKGYQDNIDGEELSESDYRIVKIIKEVLEETSERNQKIFKMTYGIKPYTQKKEKDIANYFGLNKSRISQINKNIKDKVYKKLSEKP